MTEERTDRPPAGPPAAEIEVDDHDWLGQADWIVGGEAARKARRQGLYAVYVLFVFMLAYGFPIAQAVFRTSDRTWLSHQLASGGALVALLATVVVVLCAALWVGRFRGPVVPPLPWLDLVAAAPIDRALAVRRWWRYAVAGGCVVGAMLGLTLGSGLAFAGVTGVLAILVATAAGIALGLLTARVWLWAQVRSWPGPDRGPTLLWRVPDALRELHLESLRAHSANTSTLAGSALTGNLRTARLALARPVRSARGVRLRPGGPFVVLVRRDVLGLRRQPAAFLAGLGLVVLGGMLVVWATTHPAAPPIAVSVGLLPLYLGFGAWAEGLRLQADNVGTPALLGTEPQTEASAHLVVPLTLTAAVLAACSAIMAVWAGTPWGASVSFLAVVLVLLCGGHLLAAFRGAPGIAGGPQGMVFWYVRPIMSVLLLGSLGAVFAKAGMPLWVALFQALSAAVFAWGMGRVRRLTDEHRV